MKGRISHNACTNDLNIFCRQRISQGPQNHSRSRTHTLEIHTRTLSLRSKVTTHTTPRPDTILGQRNNGAFRQRLVTVNRGDLEAPEGPRRHGALPNLPFDPGSPCRCNHRWDIGDQEAWKHSMEISPSRPFEKIQDASQPVRAELRGLTTKDIWRGQQIMGKITWREFVTKQQPRIWHALAGKTVFAWTVPNNTNDLSDFFCPG